MSVSSLPRRALGAAVATVLATTTLALAPLAFAPPASAGDVDGPGFQQPTVGECRNLPLSEMYTRSNTTAPTDCADPHTLLVFAVPRLPKGMAWSAPMEKLQITMFNKCRPAWDEFLGRSEAAREMSAYSWAWYIPTKAQRDHGARWFRCDLLLYGGSRALQLPDDVAPVLNQPPLPDSVALCLTLRKYMTACSRGHAWRATGTVRMRGTSYPSARQFQAAGDRCRSRVHSNRYFWNGPSRPEWKLGNRTMVCFTKTTN